VSRVPPWFEHDAAEPEEGASRRDYIYDEGIGSARALGCERPAESRRRSAHFNRPARLTRAHPPPRTCRAVYKGGERTEPICRTAKCVQRFGITFRNSRTFLPHMQRYISPVFLDVASDG
jgi:hypothetical protein